jgi:hypothetical protein
METAKNSISANENIPPKAKKTCSLTSFLVCRFLRTNMSRAHEAMKAEKSTYQFWLKSKIKFMSEANDLMI